MNTSVKTMVKNCKCGKTFSLTPEEQQMFYDKGLSLPNRCPCCRGKKRNIEFYPCADCGEQFGVNELEREWYLEKMGWPLPIRCPDCRKKRGEKRARKN